MVSIIIPTYNRAHLIGETIQSIIDQSYSDWECIVVDDGSTDGTDHVLKEWCLKDDRVTYYNRPSSRPKGGNACRNYGIELAKGEYIQFFDSDDLMFPNKLELSVSAFNKFKVDYVVSKTIDFNHPLSENLFIANPQNYNFDSYEISHFNYVCQNINWLTPDAMIKTILSKQIKFNETLFRGQEYNFYCKLTCLSANGKIIDEYTTKRRLHDNSIRQQFTKPEVDKQVVILRLETLKEVYANSSNKVKRWFVGNIVKNISRTRLVLGFNDEMFLLSHVLKYFGITCLLIFIMSRLTKLSLNRNEILREKLKKRLL